MGKREIVKVGEKVKNSMSIDVLWAQESKVPSF